MHEMSRAINQLKEENERLNIETSRKGQVQIDIKGYHSSRNQEGTNLPSKGIT